MGLANRLILFFHSHCTLPLYALCITPYTSHLTPYTLHFTLYAPHVKDMVKWAIAFTLYTLRFTQEPV